MTQHTHTPGPWKAVHSYPAEGYHVWWICACPAPNQEKEICSGPGGYGAQEKDAQLIAAAPELLTSLQNVLWMAEEWYKYNGCYTTNGDEYRRELNQAAVAIIKAGVP